MKHTGLQRSHAMFRIACSCLLCGFPMLHVVRAVLVPTEEIPLSSKSSNHASISASGGAFESDGWRSKGGQNHLRLKLNRPIKKNDWAAVELTLTNMDLSRNSPGKISNFFGIYHTPNGRPASGTSGSFISMRCRGPVRPGSEGFECRRDGKYAQGFRAVYRPTTKGTKLESAGYYACNNYDASKTYRFRIEFKAFRMFIYLDDVLIWGYPIFNRATDMEYVFVGHDTYNQSGYASFPNVLYKKVMVYRDDGTPAGPDPRMRQNHIKINVGGYDDMVEGWISDAPYAVKGKEWQWGGVYKVDQVPGSAPHDVYKTMRQKFHNYDTRKAFQDSVEMVYPIPDGEWTVKLHWIDHLGMPTRRIDVSLNGKRVVNDMDINTEAGGHLIPVVKEFPVSVTGNRGLTVTLFDDNRSNDLRDYFLCGLEMIRKGGTSAAPAGTVRDAVRRETININASRSSIRIPGISAGQRRITLIDGAGRCRTTALVRGIARFSPPLEPGWYAVRAGDDHRTLESSVVIQP